MHFLRYADTREKKIHEAQDETRVPTSFESASFKKTRDNSAAFRTQQIVARTLQRKIETKARNGRQRNSGKQKFCRPSMRRRV